MLGICSTQPRVNRGQCCRHGACQLLLDSSNQKRTDYTGKRRIIAHSNSSLDCWSQIIKVRLQCASINVQQYCCCCCTSMPNTHSNTTCITALNRHSNQTPKLRVLQSQTSTLISVVITADMQLKCTSSDSRLCLVHACE